MTAGAVTGRLGDAGVTVGADGRGLHMRSAGPIKGDLLALAKAGQPPLLRLLSYFQPPCFTTVAIDLLPPTDGERERHHSMRSVRLTMIKVTQRMKSNPPLAVLVDALVSARAFLVQPHKQGAVTPLKQREACLKREASDWVGSAKFLCRGRRWSVAGD